MDSLISRQAAIDALKANEDYKGYLHGDFEEILEALPSAQPEQRWIPCSERLPEEEGLYLVTEMPGIYHAVPETEIIKRSVMMRMYTKRCHWDKSWHKVIAWKPIDLTPYKGEQDG